MYYINIIETNEEEHCYFNTVKKGKGLFSILDQKRVEAVRNLQECRVFLSNGDFINALEYNSSEGMDFRRRDVDIANEIYGYSKSAAIGRFKHPRKGVKIDRTTEDVATPVPPTIMEHYRDVHLDIDLLIVNKIQFLLAKSRDIGFIYCKAMLSKHDKECRTDYNQSFLDTNQGDSRLNPLLETGFQAFG